MSDDQEQEHDIGGEYGRAEYGGYESQDALALIGVFDALSDRAATAPMRERSQRGEDRRKLFDTIARACHSRDIERWRRDGGQEQSRPVLGLIKWLMALPQVAMAIIQIVLMIL